MSNHELVDHDPKCHAYGYGRGQRMDICICTGIRIGRADERERWLRWVAVHACCEAGLVAAPGMCPWHPKRQTVTAAEIRDEPGFVG